MIGIIDAAKIVTDDRTQVTGGPTLAGHHMRCIECNQPFKPTRADVKLCSNKCRQARARRLRKPRSEHDRAFPDATGREMRRDAASDQMAKRLVAEYAFLRPGTQPEINATRLSEIRSVIAASTRL